ncbi:hypothetical protein COCOBI_01-7600 [Coccomyxa sp. Obi]|nr:hypothetical protein COCOBI_01-7600 [Coccomyxa sp. Obi]
MRASNSRLAAGLLMVAVAVQARYPDVNVTSPTAIQFVWPEQHGVYEIPSGDCPPQYAPGNGFEEVSPITAGAGKATTRPLATGTYWYPDVKLSPGGTVTFVWPGSHGVYQIPNGTCPDEFAPGNGLTELSPVVRNGKYTTPGLSAGTYWYACQVPGHCPSGQIVNVIVA